MRGARPFLRIAAFAAGVALAAAVAACGSEDTASLIPAGDAQALSDRLDALRASVADGECGQVPGELAALRGALVALPAAVDQRLRDRLTSGIDNLVSIAPDACADAALARPETTATVETTTTAPTTTTALPTTTTPVETVPPTTTATTQTPTVTTPPTTTPEGTGGVEPTPGVVTDPPIGGEG